MEYEINEALAPLSYASAKRIGEFDVLRNNDFILFTPSINYRGEILNRLKIRPSTFKHFGTYTLEILFKKLIPGINGHNYEETLHSEYKEILPSSIFLSTTVGDIVPNFDLRKGKKYNIETQFRSHNVRIGYDSIDPYLDWPHLSPIRTDQYNVRVSKKSKEQST